MPRKPSPRKSETKAPVVNYRFEDRTYQIDPSRGKVYKSFVEIETARAFAIFSSWRAENATV